MLIKVKFTEIGKSGRERVTFTFLHWKIVGSDRKFRLVSLVLDVLTMR